MTPDANGKIKGIAVPRIPWLEQIEEPDINEPEKTNETSDARTNMYGVRDNQTR